MAPDTLADTSRRFQIETGTELGVAKLVEPAIEDLGFRLVRVKLSGQGGQTLQIMAERPDGRITAEECARISRALSPLLDAYDPVQGSYRLEISSPGIDRPLVRPEDFERWVGHEARIEMREAIDGQKRFRGVIEGFADGEARLEVPLPKGKAGEGAGMAVLGFPAALIQSARLVLTDRLLALEADRQSGDPEADAFVEQAAAGERSAIKRKNRVESEDGAGRRKR